MKRFLIAASLALLAAGCATTEEEVVAPAPPEVMTTAEFLPGAVSGDMVEIQSSQLALQRSCDPAVLAFARRMIDDHTRMSNEMMGTLRAANLPPPQVVLLPTHRDALNRLNSVAPPAFESEYRNMQIAGHQEALSLHQHYAGIGEDPSLRALASGAVPIIQSHLDQAQTLPMTANCPMPPARRPGERG